jgi:glycosyltransferase involved in cell wall biosynthesis
VFGFVGRLGKEKNLDMLIPALKFVLAKRPNARLMFVGDFEYRETLETAAAECGYGDRITFTGAIAREKLGVAYAAMKVFVFPSLKDTQGWVLHEAPLAGLPVVLLDKGVTSAVVEGENGFYVENSPEAVSEKIIELLTDDALRIAMGKKSEQIASEFTEERQVGKLIELYERVIENHQSLRELEQ